MSRRLKFLCLLLYLQLYPICFAAAKRTPVNPPQVLFELGTLLDTPNFSILWHLEFGACLVNNIHGCLGIHAAYRTENNDANTYPVFPVFISYEQSFDKYLRDFSVSTLIGQNSRGSAGQIDSLFLLGWRWVNPLLHTNLAVGVGPRLILLGESSVSGVLTIKMGYSL